MSFANVIPRQCREKAVPTTGTTGSPIFFLPQNDPGSHLTEKPDLQVAELAAIGHSSRPSLGRQYWCLLYSSQTKLPTSLAQMLQTFIKHVKGKLELGSELELQVLSTNSGIKLAIEAQKLTDPTC